MKYGDFLAVLRLCDDDIFDNFKNIVSVEAYRRKSRLVVAISTHLMSSAMSFDFERHDELEKKVDKLISEEKEFSF